MTWRVRSAKWLLAGTIMAGASLNPLVSVSGENKDSGSTTASEEADPNVLRPTTNDFLNTPEYKEWSRASASVRDILKLAQALPPGSDAAEALEPTVKDMLRRQELAIGELDALLGSELILHKALAEAKRSEIRRDWIQMILDDKSSRGRTLYVQTSRFEKLKISDNPPKGMDKRAAKAP
ncbi:MAG: hypothetical protein O2923_10605 [Verrucomicrobia bacterium]|nr:hypothetical protein [Verrucomicrobiota bacterium]MDA1086461.1 hypothetical protein [Verrucomicrobiota bacterium]